jgi:tetratricopeptide (TPR) repeat protein
MDDHTKSIQIAQQSIRDLMGDNPEWAMQADRLSGLHEIYRDTKSMNTLEEIIAIIEKSLKAVQKDGKGQNRLVSPLAILLYCKYAISESIDDLDKATAAARQAVTILPDNDQNRARHVKDIAYQLGERFEKTEAMGDLNNAIKASQAAIQALHQDDPDWMLLMKTLQSELQERCSKTESIEDLQDAIIHTQKVLQYVSEDDPDRIELFHHLVFQHTRKSAQSLDLDDMQDAINAIQQALEAIPPTHNERTVFLKALTIELSGKSEVTMWIDDINMAIKVIREVLGTVSDGENDQDMLNNLLAGQLALRAATTYSLEEIKEAIQAVRGVLKTIKGDDKPKWMFWKRKLLSLLEILQSITDSIEDIKAAVQTAEEVLDTISDDDQDWMTLTDSITKMLNRKYEKMQSMEDLERGLQLTRQAVAATPLDSPDYFMWKERLLLYLSHKSSRTLREEDQKEVDETQAALREAGFIEASEQEASPRYHFFVEEKWTEEESLSDIEDEIHIYSQLLNHTETNDDSWSTIVTRVAMMLRKKFLQTSTEERLDEAIRLLSKSLESVSPKDKSWIMLVDCLATLLGDRFEHFQSTASLEEAIGLLRKGIEHTTKQSSTWVMMAHNLAGRLAQRYTLSNSVDDFEEAIHLTEECFQVVKEDSPYWTTLTRDIGTFLMERYVRTGSLEDLDAAVQRLEHAVDVITEADRQWNMLADILASCLGMRFESVGSIADLESALKMSQQCVKNTSEKHPDYKEFLNTLSLLLHIRFKTMGANADLNESLQLLRQIIKDYPHGNPNKSHSLIELSDRLGEKFQRSGSLKDLDEAIDAAQAGVDNISDGSSYKLNYLNHLSLRLGDRFVATGNTVDIERSIEILREIVDATPVSSADRPGHLNNLSGQFAEKFEKSQSITDLNEAIHLSTEALLHVSDDHPDRGRILNNLGLQIQKRYWMTGSPDDQKHAIEYCQLAMRQTKSLALSRMESCLNLIRFSAAASDWKQAYEACKIGVSLIPSLSLRTLENNDRQHIISRLSGFATDAAATALEIGEGPLEALNFLEQARGMIAKNIEDLRTDISELREKHPDLAGQFVSLRQELEPLSRLIASSTKRRQFIPWQDSTSRRYEASKSLEALINHIRELPGFSEFLLPPSKDHILESASQGPLAIINISGYRCDAILVQRQQIVLLNLKDVTRKDIEERIGEGKFGSPAALEWLWDTIADPVLNALGFDHRPAQDIWPRMWWIPTGPLSRFPLHAAGYHLSGSTNATLDRVVSSYSSSIKDLISSRRRATEKTRAPAANKVVAIGMPETPGLSNLIYATEEVEKLDRLWKSIALQVVKPPSERNEVLSALENCNIFHFAGHGYTHRSDPLMSTLFLKDWETQPLTVSSLLQINLRHSAPLLAYLSACGTGRVRDGKLMDEGLHLISACQLAGFRHVIGTMWEVDDQASVDMAVGVYQFLGKEESMRHDVVARALHAASKTVRERWIMDNIASGALNTETRHPAGNDTRVGLLIPGKLRKRKADELRDIGSEDASWHVEPFWVPFIHFGI